MAAAADTPIIALFISSFFPDPPSGRVVVATKATPLFGANMLVVGCTMASSDCLPNLGTSFPLIKKDTPVG